MNCVKESSKSVQNICFYGNQLLYCYTVFLANDVFISTGIQIILTSIKCKIILLKFVEVPPIPVCLQYKKSKEVQKCAGLFLPDKLIEYSSVYPNVLRTSINVVINYYFFSNFFLRVFTELSWGQNMKLGTKEDFFFGGNFISRLISH